MGRPVGPWKRAYRRGLWLLATVAIAMVRRLPLGVAGALGEAAGLVAWLVAYGPRRTALANLEAAFGDRLPAARRRQVARGVFRHFGRVAAEWAVFPRLSPERLAGIVDTSALWPACDQALASGRGAIALTAHLGNWELLGAVGARRYRLSVVARRVYYEPFNRIVEQARTSLGMETIYQDDPPRRILRALASGGLVGILPDQDVFDLAGTWVDFFGRPAWTPTGPAAVARISGAPLLPLYLVREGGHYRVVADAPIQVSKTEDQDATLVAATRAWTEVLERHITAHPEQWPWFHKRWRTTPEKLAARGRAAVAAGHRAGGDDGSRDSTREVSA